VSKKGNEVNVSLEKASQHHVSCVMTNWLVVASRGMGYIATGHATVHRALAPFIAHRPFGHEDRDRAESINPEFMKFYTYPRIPRQSAQPTLKAECASLAMWMKFQVGEASA
jgi:hypothetical protein